MLSQETGAPPSDIVRVSRHDGAYVESTYLTRESPLGRKALAQAAANLQKYGFYADDISLQIIRARGGRGASAPNVPNFQGRVVYRVQDSNGEYYDYFPRGTRRATVSNTGINLEPGTIELPGETFTGVPPGFFDPPPTPSSPEPESRPGEFYFTKGPLWSGRKVQPRI